MNGVSSQINYRKKLLEVLFLSTLAGSILLPYFNISSNLPAFDVSDIGFPFIALLGIIWFRNEIFRTFIENKKVFLFFIFFLLAVVLSILLNKRWDEYRDWFEFAKYLKFITVVGLFLWLLKINQFMIAIKIIFIVIFIFNVFHYFDFFNFNSLIEPFYAPAHHLDYFGLNSIGEPATKRALGTLGNPNNNGFLFLIFCFLFLPSKKVQFGWKPLILPTLAIIGLIACQSRTIFLAYLILLFLYFLLIQRDWRYIVYFSLFSSVIFTIFITNGNTYIESLGDASATQYSAISRMHQWSKILNEMPGFWFFGHGPDKQFFEQNGIFAESEFMLLLFRYGCIGVILFLMWFIALPINKFTNRLKLNRSMFIFLFILIFSGITNAPFHNVKLNVFIACVLALEFLKPNYSSEEN
jgi:hypothetical protein